MQLALLALLALGSILPAAAQVRTVSTPTVEPAQVRAGVAENVRIWADISDPNVIASGVNLLKVGAPGTNPTIVGVLKDDGTGGDEIAGDGRFSIELTVNEPAAKTFVYRISAPFKGTLLRTVTPDLPLAVVANRAPVAVPGTNQAVHTGAVVPLDGRDSYDLDGDLLRFSWTLLLPAGSTARLDNANYVKPSFTADIAGTFRVQLVVNDGHVDSVLKELTVTASSGNTVPTARLVPISSPFTPASPVALSGGGSFDPDGQLLTYAWTLKGKPATSTTAGLSATTGATPQLLPDKPGRYVIELTVNDGSANSAPTQALVTLYAPNTPPAVNAGADQSGKPTAGVVNLAGTIGVDPEGDSAVKVQWTFIAKPAGSTATLANADALTPSFTPDQPGDYLIELAVTDNRGAIGKARVVVRAITLPPVAITLLSASPGSGTVPLAVQFQSQAAGGTGSYNYGWTFGDNTTSATQNPSHTYTQVGTFNATVTATDGQNHSASKSVPITVNPVVVVTNQAPQVNAGPNQTVVLPALATLTGSATDDGLPNPPHQLTYLWSLVSGPTGPAITDPTLPATTALFPTPGTYVLRLTASDSALSGSGTVTITVGDVGPSLQPIADRTIALGSRLQLELVANDGNPTDQLTYSLLVGPTGAAVNPSPRLHWTPSASQLGTHTFTVQVTDAYGHGDSKSFHVTVVQGNQPPLLAVQAAATLPRGATFSRTLTATDPDNQPLVFALTSRSGRNDADRRQSQLADGDHRARRLPGDGQGRPTAAGCSTPSGSSSL